MKSVHYGMQQVNTSTSALRLGGTAGRLHTRQHCARSRCAAQSAQHNQGSLFCFGTGYLGGFLLARASSEGWLCSGTRRTANSRNDDFALRTFDGTAPVRHVSHLKCFYSCVSVPSTCSRFAVAKLSASSSAGIMRH